MKMYSQRGFSLIELMVVVTILVILLAFGIPSFKTMMQNSQIRNAAEAIENGLNLARTEAIHRNTITQFLLGTGSLWQVCADTATPCLNIIQARTAAEGSPNAAVAATFSTLSFNGYGRVGTALAGASAVFNITNPTAGSCTVVRCLRVIVTQGGQVRMCDPALANTNPQGC